MYVASSPITAQVCPLMVMFWAYIDVMDNANKQAVTRDLFKKVRNI